MVAMRNAWKPTIIKEVYTVTLKIFQGLFPLS